MRLEPMKPQPLNVTLLSPGLSIHGNVILDHGVSCFGVVDGTVVSNAGLVHIGQGGMVKGQVEGEHVRVDGTVEGDVHARGVLEINGRVKGNVYYYGTIRLGPRASLEGQIKRKSDLTIESAGGNVQQLSRAAASAAAI
jgi:cytoskeletal protein CcmA (bactofilin family)